MDQSQDDATVRPCGGESTTTLTFPLADVASNSLNYRSSAWVYLATGSLFSWFIGRMLHRERQLVAALTDAHGRLRDAAARPGSASASPTTCTTWWATASPWCSSM